MRNWALNCARPPHEDWFSLTCIVPGCLRNAKYHFYKARHTARKLAKPRADCRSSVLVAEQQNAHVPPYLNMFKRLEALQVNSSNSVLRCYLGMAHDSG